MKRQKFSISLKGRGGKPLFLPQIAIFFCEHLRHLRETFFRVHLCYLREILEKPADQLPAFKYIYDDKGFRMQKIAYNSAGGVQKTTWYVRDASGNVLSVYEKDGTVAIAQKELPVYGSGRVGIAMRSGSNYEYYYELKDHLGNVRAVVDVNKTVYSSSSYYPFGLTMQKNGSYRYGYQGEFAEDESQETDWNSFELRMYDPLIARWTAPDPYRQFASPYLGMGNNPIYFTDPNGGCVDGQGNIIPCPDGVQDGLNGQHTVILDGATVMPDDPTPFQVGVEWLTGNGPRDRWFTNGDTFTEMLKQHNHVDETRKIIANSLAQGGLSEGKEGSNPYDLGGIEGVPKYINDYSTLATAGATGNLAVTYLGSYNLKYTVTSVDVENRTATVQFRVHNSSTIQSATRPPVLGYTQWWKNNVGNRLNEALKSGPMSTTTQTFGWTETIGF